MRKSKKEEFYQEEADWEQEEERPSRTQKKKAAQNLQKIGEILVTMPASEIDKLELDKELKDAILMTKNISKHGAKKRQMQYIGVLMRELDTNSLTSIMEKIPLLNKS